MAILAKGVFGVNEMEKNFYNARDIAEIMGICYAKALAFIKYSGITYVKINRTYLIEKSVFERFISETKSLNLNYKAFPLSHN